MDANQESQEVSRNREFHPGIVEVPNQKREIILNKSDYNWLGHATEKVEVTLLRSQDGDFYFGEWIDDKDLKETSQQIDRRGKGWRGSANGSFFSKLPTFIKQNFYHPEVDPIDQPRTAKGVNVYSVKTARSVRPYFIAIRLEGGESAIIRVAECIKGGNDQKKVLKKISHHT